MRMPHPLPIARILAALQRRYPRGDRPWAGRADPFRRLIATILSAQSTDAQVDLITPELFRRFPTPGSLAAARRAEVERIIRSVGLYRTKAGNIIAAARMLSEQFGNRVPGTIEELTRLPGVGRKTASVVLITCFGAAAMPVDTHVFRVSRRIGIARGKTPEQVEAELTRIIPQRTLGAAHFWLIHHGRTLCTARSPQCPKCPINRWCRFAKSQKIR